MTIAKHGVSEGLLRASDYKKADQLRYEPTTEVTSKNQTLLQLFTYSRFSQYFKACKSQVTSIEDLAPLQDFLSAKICYERLQDITEKNEVSSEESSSGTGDSDSTTISGTVPKSGASSKGQVQKSKYPLWRKLIKSYYSFIIWSACLQVILCLTFVAPVIILGRMIDCIASGCSYAYLYSFLMFLSCFLYSVTTHHVFYRAFCGALQQRAALLTAVYNKCLVTHPETRREFSPGDILNLASVDIETIFIFTQNWVYLVSIPSRLLLALTVTYYILGPGALGIAMVVVTLMPLSILVAACLDKFTRQYMTEKDKRLDIINEMLAGIKIIKFFGWEEAFLKKIHELRRQEANTLKRFLCMESATGNYLEYEPFFAVASYSVYLLWDSRNVLTADAAFSTLLLFGYLRYYFIYLPNSLSQLVQARVSLKRIENFLNCKEITDDIEREIDDQKIVIDIQDASFSWNENEPVLKSINLRINQGELVAIMGRVGSGKTSLIAAILGELRAVKGKIAVRELKTSYVPQEAWIQTGTLRNNIIFCDSYQRVNYSRVVKACNLLQDFRNLPKADSTIIGDKGANLSGGQKQRVSIARAVYHDADLYLFDDPLSALDAHVADEVFKDVLSNKGLLRNKTRVLATNNVSILPSCDRIVVIENGRISRQGSYQQLSEDEEFQLITKVMAKDDEKETTSRDEDKPSRVESVQSSLHMESLSESQFHNNETMKGGKVQLRIYKKLLKSFGFFLVATTLMFYIFYRGFDFGASLWIKIATKTGLNQTSEENSASVSSLYFLGIYTGLGSASGLSIFIAFRMLCIGCLRIAMKLHENMLYSLMRAPLSFFDKTPVGRIMNRFSKDVNVMDLEIYKVLDDYMEFLLVMIISVVMIIVYVPVMVLVFLAVSFLFYMIKNIFMEASRQSKRLALITRSPVLTDFSETLCGVPVIRAFGAEQMLQQRNFIRVDVSQNTFLHSLVVIRWSAIRMDAVINITNFCLMLLMSYYGTSFDPGNIGLIITYSISVSRFFARFIECASLFENSIISAERLIEYSEIPSEASWKFGEPLSPAWPSKGVIEFEDFSMKYREDLPLTLKDLNLRIPSGHKVGVVGRTGAGKSSLTLALFRMVEASSGKISIDGTDIARIGLHDLRKKLTMIPQDPILFKGDLRSNLDPLKEFNDDQIIDAMRTARLRENMTLDYEISEGGSNLSLGERQLICLGRALLRKSKILVLDEATAAVDNATDALIQATIRQMFGDSTVITIAHRLHTVLNYDLIIVLANGQIAEKGHPKQLLMESNSIFYSMAKDAGII